MKLYECRCCGKKLIYPDFIGDMCMRCKRNFKKYRSTFSNVRHKMIQKYRKCQLCGWNKESLDIHHILPLGEGGNNDIENLIAVCPNCHRILQRDVEDILEMKKNFNNLELIQVVKLYYHEYYS